MSSLVYNRHKESCVRSRNGIFCRRKVMSITVPPTDVRGLGLRSSVADACHFGVDPDPRIHASD
jgi:hypothetical protein